MNVNDPSDILLSPWHGAGMLPATATSVIQKRNESEYKI